ncbi:hypothetical protein GH810_03350, partial [Acetobacterium paludosum]
MMLQNLISMLLYVSFVIYVMFGAYSLALNKEERLNRVFAVLCFCFSIWGFAFAATNSAGTYAEAIFLRRISVFGWGVAYSLILHFVIVLTESNWSQKKKWPILFLTLYLPSVFFIFFFCLYPQTANEQVQMVKSVAGWTSVSSENILEKLFYLYYLGFSATSFLLLIKWYLKSSDHDTKNKALYLLIAFSVALSLGTFTDVLANSFSVVKLPSLAPIVIMIPATTIFYIIHKFGLMRPKEHKIEYLEGVILNTNSRMKLFMFIGTILAVGSAINFFIRLVHADDRLTGIMLSCFLALLGAIITSIPYHVKTVKNQEKILAIILSILLPLLMLSYSTGPFSNIIWPVPIFFLMITMIFNNKKIFYTIAFLTILMGIILWVRIPDFDMLVGFRIYSLRLLLYGIGISLTIIIRNIYVSRLDENAKQEEFQKMISDISADFLTINHNDYRKKITDLLKRSGSYVNADRAYICSFSKNIDTFSYAYRWLDEHVKPTIRETEKYETAAFPWCKERLLNNQIVYLPNPGALPLEADEERAEILKHQIQSIIGV